MKTKIFIVVLMVCTLSHTASAATKLLPLLESDTPPGCSCSFADSKKPNAPTIFFWPQTGDKQAVLRDSKGVYRVKLNSERYMPVQRDPQQYGDRMVLYFADAQWQIQALGSVTNACKPRERNCSGVSYKGLLQVQHEGGQRTNIDIWGRCGC